ncbi:hypothetical protein [Lactiplantibacillus plantarum]|uniref:hypothetical protein n=1 Tax=Lactiplantibacillus plantarum TaxID=1590 RepID=UPI003F536981
MSIVTAHAGDGLVDAIFQLATVVPYDRWLQKNGIAKSKATIHNAAQFVIDTQSDWNHAWQREIKKCLPDLKRIANGADLKIINQTIQTYTMNYESTEQVELK